MLAQVIRLNDNPAGGGGAITFQGLVEQNNTNYDRITDFTTGFSFIDYARPEVAWNTPSTAGTTVVKTGTVKVNVTGFKVGTAAGDDGIVRLTFPGNAGCADIDTNTDASAGKGEITISLAALGGGCSGSVTMKAILYDNQATPQPIAPEVSASLTATLQ